MFLNFLSFGSSQICYFSLFSFSLPVDVFLSPTPPFTLNLTLQIPLEHFRRSDVEIQARFSHENVAELFGAILREGTLHVFMEAGEGGSVLEKLDSCGPMREPEVIWVTRQVLQALEYLHSHGVIHHDIKRKALQALPPNKPTG